VTVHLVLASASPARLTLLKAAGVTPTVVVSSVDEPAVTAAAETAGALHPSEVALLLARAKAEDVAGELRGSSHHDLVVGCDSVLELDGAALGKPADAAEAVTRWEAMRGRTGELHTGHWLVDLRPADRGGTGGTVGAVATTVVHFGHVDDAELAAYVATGEPLDVAGAFTLERLSAPYVDAIEGDPSNVTGLSLPTLRRLLLDLDVPWRDLRDA
jgi:septum formation protein